MAKRWWILALVFALALSLTSCSKKKAPMGPVYGFGYCDGSMGSFDVYVIPASGNPGMYELSIIPVQLDDPGDIAKITLANSSLDYKEMVTQVVLNNEQEVFAGTITESDLETYELVAITPYESGVNFLEQESEKDAICTIPLPGDDGTGQVEYDSNY